MKRWGFVIVGYSIRKIGKQRGYIYNKVWFELTSLMFWKTLNFELLQLFFLHLRGTDLDLVFEIFDNYMAE